MKMTKIITVCLFAGIFSCSDDSTKTPQDLGSDTGPDVADTHVDLFVDMKSSSFPDPDRESKTPCLDNLDCERGWTCDDVFQLCTMTMACGSFGGPDPDEVRGCLIGEDGQSRFTEKECDEDLDCPAAYPICIFKACQVFSRCETDADCKSPEECINDTWCQEPLPL